jgi:hypothetical protein
MPKPCARTAIGYQRHRNGLSRWFSLASHCLSIIATT